LLFGWQAIPFVLFSASILGLLYVAPSLINKKINLKSQIPFGPHIILASLMYFLYGELLYNLVLNV
jgi:leader peptidase (prepilin peptidase)/N-methyltransferase